MTSRIQAHISFKTLFIAMFAIPFLLGFILLNTLFLLISDLLGINRRLSLAWIKKYYAWVPKDASKVLSPQRQVAVEQLTKQLLTKFKADGYNDQAGSWHYQATENSYALCVDHASAVNTHSRRPKRAYYLEGNHFEMGLLLGLLAEKDIKSMSVDYVDNVVFEFAGLKGKYPVLGMLLADFIYRLATFGRASLPAELRAEIYGLWAGSHSVNRHSRVLTRDLMVLNYGVDIILSLVYAGGEPILRALGIKLNNWVHPAACNGFAALGEAAGGDGQAFMGRDFMFPTCGVFGDVAAPIMYKSNGMLGPKPDSIILKHPLPVLCFSSPGMVGAVAALNKHGLAMGVDMVNGRNTSSTKIGLNSLMMVRHTVQQSRSIEKAVRNVRRTHRGVSWLYLVADAQAQRAAVLEAGYSGQKNNFLRRTPRELRKAGLLPRPKFIKRHPTCRFRKGLAVRWNNWKPSLAWMDYNPALFDHFGFPWKQDDWGPRAMFGKDQKERVVPDAWYFAPERQIRTDILVVSNHYLLPEMRLLSMNEWTAKLASAGGNYQDFQFRYDALNRTLIDTLARLEQEGKKLDLDSAQDIINFLRPYNRDQVTPGPYWFYYGEDSHGNHIPEDQVPVGGVVSVFDLKRLKLRSLYGWYSDQWIELNYAQY